MNIITIQRYSDLATMPEFVFPMAMGYEIFSSETKLIEVGKRNFIDTGVSINVPVGSFAQIVGTTSMNAIEVHTATTTFDSYYSGPLRILLSNNGTHDLPIMIGDKIALLVVMPVDPPIISVHQRGLEVDSE